MPGTRENKHPLGGLNHRPESVSPLIPRTRLRLATGLDNAGRP
jgi:hypothetical protein